MSAARQLWAAQAWIGGGWRADVLLAIGADGRFASVQPGRSRPADATPLPGPVLPGMVDAHSHAFQRAFAGLAERRDGAEDDFWQWRERMYRVALRITPAQLRAVAAQLYVELLQGGYTQVCEFHYLHHAPDGSRSPDPLAMSRALAEAAAEAGIGLTLLPVLYQRAGFGAAGLRDEQRRFAAGADEVLAMRDGIRGWRLPQLDAGVAVHSLRAASPAAIAHLLQRLGDDGGPIHIHIAEQQAEVDDCIAATGRRPIDWLHSAVALDRRWQLVHATQASADEIAAVASSGAGVVVCPNTEANLGDGRFDLPGWLRQRAAISIGSDSQVGRCWPHELRLLEYSQRLALRQRNLAADPEAGQPASAARLFDACVAGGTAAAGFAAWGLVAGARADLLVLDPRAPGLRGIPGDHQLDALVFATDAPAFAEVWVAGQRVGPAAQRDLDGIGDRFEAAMRTLWRDAFG